MYSVDSQDQVVELEDAPQSDVGAPLPVLLADEGSVILAYLISEPDPTWDGTYVNVVSPDTDGGIAIILFNGVCSRMFGAPNDEAFNGHPLYDRGLKPYSVCEVKCSSWVRHLERLNSVHPMHSPSSFDRYRHFIFAFHDSTFECVANGFSVTIHRGSIRSAIKEMVSLLAD